MPSLAAGSHTPHARIATPPFMPASPACSIPLPSLRQRPVQRINTLSLPTGFAPSTTGIVRWPCWVLSSNPTGVALAASGSGAQRPNRRRPIEAYPPDNNFCPGDAPRRTRSAYL
ncbi:hypothetical protein SEVIR_2G237300v4 [Setaria viridis]